MLHTPLGEQRQAALGAVASAMAAEQEGWTGGIEFGGSAWRSTAQHGVSTGRRDGSEIRFGENRWEQRSEEEGDGKRKNRGREQERKQRH